MPPVRSRQFSRSRARAASRGDAAAPKVLARRRGTPTPHEWSQRIDLDDGWGVEISAESHNYSALVRFRSTRGRVPGGEEHLGFEIPREKLQSFVDQLHGKLDVAKVLVPLVDLRALANRHRGRAGLAYNERDVTIAHVLYALDLMLQNGDEAALREIEHLAVRYLYEKKNERWAAGASRARRSGQQAPIPGQSLMANIRAVIATSEDELDAAAADWTKTANENLPKRGLRFDRFDVMAETITDEAVLLFPELKTKANLFERQTEFARYLRSSATKLSTLEPEEIGVAALRALEMPAEKARGVFQYRTQKKRSKRTP